MAGMRVVKWGGVRRRCWLAVALALAVGAGCGRGTATPASLTPTGAVVVVTSAEGAAIEPAPPPTLPPTATTGPPTPTQTRVVQRTWTSAAPSRTVTPSPAPNTVPTLTVTAELSETAALSETPLPVTPTLETPTPLPPVIGPANAMSVTLRTAFGPGLAGAEGLTATPTLTAGAPLTATPAGGLAVRIDQVAWSPDGEWVAAVGGFGVRVYAARTGAALWSARAPSWASSATFSPNGRQVAAGTAGGTVLVFAAETGALEAVLFGKSGRVETLAWAQALTRTVLLSLNGDTPHLWDVSAQAHLGSLPAAHGARLAVSGGAAPLVAVGAGTTVRVWVLADLLQAEDPATAAPWRTLEQPASLTSLALSADGRRLAVGTSQGTVTVWNVPTARVLQTFARLAAAAERLAYAPDGRLLASAHADRLARLWAVGGASAPLAALSGHADRITSIAFAPDGRALATAGWEGVVRVWGVEGP
jgi:hypothetical protein